MLQLAENTPLISVIIPNFNCADYLPKAIESVLLQTLKNIEIIVVDDGSTDGSRELLRSKANQVQNLRVYQRERKGPAAARNFGIIKAKGRYIAFLDADDQWQPNKLATQVAFHELHPDIAFSFTNYEQVDLTGKACGDGFSVWERFSHQLTASKEFRILKDPLITLYLENPVGTSTVLARKEALVRAGLFDEYLPSAEDMDMWLTLAASNGVAFSESVSTKYSIRLGSESTYYDKRIQALKLINNRFSDKVSALDPSALSQYKARMDCAAAQQKRQEHNHLQALKFHLRAFINKPTKQQCKAIFVDLYRSLYN